MEDRPQDRPSWANMTEMQRNAALDHAAWEKRAGINTETREEREMRRRLEKARDEWERKDEEPGVNYNLLCVYKAGEWIDIAKRSPAQIELFGDLWRQGELAIMFADTGVGKSILAVQIADALARGQPIEPVTMPTEPRRVLYLDFELSFTQFSERYARTSEDGKAYEDEYKFHENFLRGEIEWDEGVPKRFRNFAEFMFCSIESSLRSNQADVLIVDNITYLSSGTANSSTALGLMQNLKFLKERLAVSILVLAHTPKRPFSQQLTINDLQGSKMLSNFADSVFCVGVSHFDRGVRYIKHIKRRSGEITHDASNVLIYRIEKPDNFIRFAFMSTGYERECLKYGNGQPTRTRQTLIAAARELKRAGRSERFIANELNISPATAHRYLTE